MREDRELYRRYYGADMQTRRLTHGETDLAIRLPQGLWQPQLEAALSAHIVDLRAALQAYISLDPGFAASHIPYAPRPDAPGLVLAMAQATAMAGVGPMAAVAGAFAQAAGMFLASHSREVMVENGGDIYLSTTKERIVGIYAGEHSPFSGKLGLKIPAALQPLGLCTSSGTVGPSFSYGKADAAVILAGDALLADAAATALGNRVKTSGDAEAAVIFASTIPGVRGALVLVGETLAAWGEIELATF